MRQFNHIFFLRPISKQWQQTIFGQKKLNFIDGKANGLASSDLRDFIFFLLLRKTAAAIDHDVDIIFIYMGGGTRDSFHSYPTTIQKKNKNMAHKKVRDTKKNWHNVLDGISSAVYSFHLATFIAYSHHRERVRYV